MNDFTHSNKRLAQPHNVYNIFFMLEQQRLFQEKGGTVHQHQQLSFDLAGYDSLDLPDLPPRFQNVQMPQGWFVPGKNSKRKHVKSHGMTSFAELARTVAVNWKSADKETKDYCATVVRILKNRHTELTKIGGMCRLSTIDSVSSGSKKKIQRRITDNKTNDSALTKLGVMLCLPTMDSVSPTHAFGDQPRQQYLGTRIFPVAHEQGSVNSCDNGRTCVEDVYHQYQLNRTETIPNTTTILGDDSFHRSNVKMSQQMPSCLTRQGIKWVSMPNVAGGGGDNELEFPIITDVSRRATISNMIGGFSSFGKQPTLQGMAPRHEEICSFGAHPRPSNSCSLAAERPKSSDQEQLNAMYKGEIRSFGLQEMYPMCQEIRPFGEHRRSSAPKHLKTSKQEQHKAIYKIQEVDITDSDVFGMWLPSKVQEADQVYETLGSDLARGFHAWEYLEAMQRLEQEKDGDFIK